MKNNINEEYLYFGRIPRVFENGLDECTCPKTKCKLHGKCEECIAKHKARNKLPRCKREKKGFSKKK